MATNLHKVKSVNSKLILKQLLVNKIKKRLGLMDIG